jgi:hypothetical protein
MLRSGTNEWNAELITDDFDLSLQYRDHEISGIGREGFRHLVTKKEEEPQRENACNGETAEENPNTSGHDRPLQENPM